MLNPLFGTAGPARQRGSDPERASRTFRTLGETRSVLYAQLACVWEATARKAGNVHRYRDFDDTSYVDFLASAAAIAPVLAARDRPVGETVLACVRATGAVVRTNTNLGIVLLLAPLA